MSDSKVSRRLFLQRLGALGLVGAGTSTLLTACGGDDDSSSASGDDASGDDASGDADFSCDDVSGLSDSELEQRETQIEALEYVENTPNPEENCANCSFWQEPEGDANCGGCQLFPGPVHPNGWCNSWGAAG